MYYILLLLPLVLINGEYYTSVTSKLDQVVYMYPNEIRSERELGICKQNQVCGVVNKRFWLPSLVYRFCRCPASECPFNFSNDNKSTALDNRSQMKTCEKTSNMEVCKDREIGLSVADKKKTKETKKVISVSCRCDWPAYWKLRTTKNNGTYAYSEYACTKLTKCVTTEFCGHLRADTYSSYYQCSCPKNNICINTDKIVRNVTELLYTGPMYRAYCTPLDYEQNLTD